ncbi:MAG: hypothetical protein GY732_03175, partial [Gammaproteobacteria bacterium]|nr:hypothetical protein [Gammaproteobacteria bacterium]
MGLFVASLNVTADVPGDMQAGLPLTEVLQNFVNEGGNLNDAVFAAVQADTARAGDIVLAAMGLIPEDSADATYPGSDLGDGQIITQVTERYFSGQRQLINGDFDTLSYDMLVDVSELEQLLGTEQITPSADILALLQSGDFDPVEITLLRNNSTAVITQGAELVVAAIQAGIKQLPVIFIYDGSTLVNEKTIIQAAIEAGADPNLVTEAAAAGRFAIFGT